MPKLIPSLNGLRALSILFVLIAHVQIMNFHLPNGPGGQVGVNIFFVISGFLITYLLLKEEAANGFISLKSFFIRRSLRIFPVFYFLLLVYFILQLAGVLHIGMSSWVSSLTYTKYFFAKGQDDWETGHVWSLCVEEHFYLLWPFIFTRFKPYRHVFAIAVVAIIPLVRLLTSVDIMHLFTRADALMWGCLFALYHQQALRLITNNKWLAIMPFAGLLFCLASKKVIPGSHTLWGEHFILAFFGSFGLVTNVCIGLVILVSITYKNNLYFAFLNSRPMDYLGRLSYSIYLWQQLFFSKSIGIFAQFPFNLLCLLLASICSYYFIEKPFLRLKDRFHSKKKVFSTVTANGEFVPT